MRVTITSDSGEVYESRAVWFRHSRLGWLLIGSDGEPLTLDDWFDDAAHWADANGESVDTPPQVTK